MDNSQLEDIDPNVMKNLHIIMLYSKLRWYKMSMNDLNEKYDKYYHHVFKKYPKLIKYNHKIYPRTQLSVGEPTGTSGNYHPNPDLIFKFM